MPNNKYIELYADFLRKHIKVKKPVKVVFDCSDGVAGIVLKKLLNASARGGSSSGGKRLPLNAVLLNAKPDGNFPSHGPNPMLRGALDQLKKEVKKQKANFGAAFDGDGDRVFFVDDKGREIDPNESGYLLTKVFKPPYVIGAVSSHLIKNGKVFVSKIGHSYAKQLMREKKANLGLEHSGHYFFKKFFYADSGILAAIEVANFVSGLKIKLSDWLDNLPKYYRSGEINFEVENKGKIIKKIESFYKKQAVKISKLDGLTMEFGSPAFTAGQNPDRFWFNIRPSNTEPLLRLNMEAMSQRALKENLKDIKKLIKN